MHIIKSLFNFCAFFRRHLFVFFLRCNIVTLWTSNLIHNLFGRIKNKHFYVIYMLSFIHVRYVNSKLAKIEIKNKHFFLFVAVEVGRKAYLSHSHTHIYFAQIYLLSFSLPPSCSPAFIYIHNAQRTAYTNTRTHSRIDFNELILRLNNTWNQQQQQK